MAYFRNKERGHSAVTSQDIESTQLFAPVSEKLSSFHYFYSKIDMNSISLQELKNDVEEDKYLISFLKKKCFDQSREIEKLRSKIENFQKNYEILLEKSKNPEGLCQSIVENGKLERNKTENFSQ